MAERRDIDGLLMDWLYEESEPSADDLAAHGDELAAYQRVRAQLRELPEEEPPPALSAILLHEAAKRAPARGRAVAATPTEDDAEAGILAWVARLFRPIVSHPAAAAMATLVLVAGVAGSLYLRGHRPATPQTESRAAAPEAPAEAVLAEPAPIAFGEPGGEAPAAAAPAVPATDTYPGYTVALADDEAERELAALRDKARDPAKGTGEERKDASKASRTKAATATPSSTGRAASERKREVSANAVSGADQLIFADDADVPGASGASGTQRGAVGGAPVPAQESTAPAGAPQRPSSTSTPPPSDKAASGGSATKAKSSEKPAVDPKTLAWARDQQRTLMQVAEKDCRQAARIANDILDRAPAFYYDQVQDSSAVKRCAWFVKDERDRREERRTKRRSNYDDAVEADVAEPSTK